MTTTYTPAGTTAADRMNIPTECGHCERSGLKTTVKMVSPTGTIVWMGTGCAAKAMGIPAKEFDALRKAADEKVAAIARAEADAEDAKFQAFLDAAAPGFPTRFEQIKALGGFAVATVAYKAG